MLKNEKLKDVRIAFIFSATLKDDSWRIWEKCIRSSNNWYYWEVKEGKRELQSDINYSPALENYILVEDFFLSKQLFNVGRDYTMISRFTPNINLELIFPIKHGPITPTVIISFYRAVGVVTLTLNMVFEEIVIDDLIYIKSLKWNSIKHYDEAPIIDVVIKGDCRKDQYFCNIFKLIWDEVFKDKLETKIKSESILDLTVTITILSNRF